MTFELLYISLFGLVALIQVSFLFVFRFRKVYQQQYPNNNQAASVIICAKNEAANLKLFLPSVLQQRYAGHFEVIVVNDASTDNTGAVLMQLREQTGKLKVITVTTDELRTLPGKKFALQKGIAAAENDYLLLTDADCRPVSDQWLQQMMNAAGTGKEIVLGYGAYEPRASLLNMFIRWETVQTLMQYSGMVHAGWPYMGVGRNLLYRRTLLKGLEADAAFGKIYAGTPSGDDDLTIGRIATKNNVGICLDKGAKTISLPKQTWQEWWRQKTRHVSTGKYYAAGTKWALSLFGLSHGLFWLLLLVGCVMLKCPVIIITIAAARIILYWANAMIWYRKLGERKLFLCYPIGDFFWCIYNLILSPYIFWKNKTQWK